MSPLKLVIIAILLYLAYRLFIGDWKKKKGQDREGAAENNQENGQVEDILVEDPICHTLVPKQQAIRLKQKGTEDFIYFCSEECCDRFVSQTGEKE